MSLSRFNSVGRITSIPQTNSLVLLVYKAFGESDWRDVSKLKAKSINQSNAFNSKHKKGDHKTLALLKAKQAFQPAISCQKFLFHCSPHYF